MKKNIIIMTILFVSVMVVSCSNKRVYSKPTLGQVNDFITQESIKVEAIKEASEFTIILYQDNNISGHYILYQDQDGKLYSGKVEGISKGINPVCLGGVATGKEPFVTIIINDEVIFNQASYLEVTFDDGNVVKEEIENRGIVVVYKNHDSTKAISYTKIAIYDEDDSIIYEN